MIIKKQALYSAIKLTKPNKINNLQSEYIKSRFYKTLHYIIKQLVYVFHSSQYYTLYIHFIQIFLVLKVLLSLVLHPCPSYHDREDHSLLHQLLIVIQTCIAKYDIGFTRPFVLTLVCLKELKEKPSVPFFHIINHHLHNKNYKRH